MPINPNHDIFFLFNERDDYEKASNFFYFLDQRLSDQIHRLNLEFRKYYQEKKASWLFLFFLGLIAGSLLYFIFNCIAVLLLSLGISYYVALLALTLPFIIYLLVPQYYISIETYIDDSGAEQTLNANYKVGFGISLILAFGMSIYLSIVLAPRPPKTPIQQQICHHPCHHKRLLSSKREGMAVLTIQLLRLGINLGAPPVVVVKTKNPCILS